MTDNRALFDKINCMDYHDAVTRYLYEALDTPLMTAQNRYAGTLNDKAISRAKNKIFKGRGYATKRDYAFIGSILSFIIGFYDFIQMRLNYNDMGYKYSSKFALAIMAFIVCIGLHKYFKFKVKEFHDKKK